MNPTKQKLIERVDQLIEKAQTVATTRRNNSSMHVVAPDTVEATIFHEWKNNSQNFIFLICGENNPYYRNFIDGVKSAFPGDVNHGLGILKALKEDLELGYLTRIRDALKYLPILLILSSTF